MLRFGKINLKMGKKENNKMTAQEEFDKLGEQSASYIVSENAKMKRRRWYEREN